MSKGYIITGFDGADNAAWHVADWEQTNDYPNTPYRGTCACGWRGYYMSSASKALSDARWHSGE